MTLNRSSQLVLASAVSLLAAGLLSACGTLTVDFVYVTSAKAAGSYNYGEVDVFEINSESGRMRTIPTSPFPSGGRNPVAAATAPDYASLYVANEDDNSIVQFIIGTDGKLYPEHTVNTPGIYPLAITTSGSYLFVADLYQPLATCSSSSPCSGSIGVFPIGTDDALGTEIANSTVGGYYWPLALSSSSSHIITPTAITTAGSGAYVYVTAYDATSGGGYVFGFSVGSDGTLTALSGSPWSAGVKPSGLAASPDGAYLYVTDSSSANVLAYSISGGLLTQVNGSPFAAGNGPSAVVVSSTGQYVYVTNGSDSNLTAYSASNGVLTALGTYTTGNQPVAIGIDPALNEYLYTVNFLGSSVSGFQINASTGSLLNSQGITYGTNAEPTAVAAIPHGAGRKN